MSKNSKFLIILIVVVLGMFAFGYANVPLFKMFCSAVGIGTSSPEQMQAAAGEQSGEVDTSREIRVLFTTVVNDDLPVMFEAGKHRETVHPGELDQVDYRFVNMSDDTLYFRPVHSVYPAEANKKYDMIECFCFKDMMMLPRQEVNLPLIYRFHTDLDESVKRVTMHYGVFERDPTAADWDTTRMQMPKEMTQ